MDESESLSHSKWECKYHLVFIPKCRRKVLYEQLRRHLGEVFRALAEQKQCRILEGHLMPDHVHMLISIRRRSRAGIGERLEPRGSPGPLTVVPNHAQFAIMVTASRRGCWSARLFRWRSGRYRRIASAPFNGEVPVSWLG
jgi:hypothetical protein